jgi:monovalent cation/hydrogen antiporter
VEELLTVVGLAAVVTAVSAVARRLGLLAPILLVLVGIVLSLVPGVPQVRLEPDLVLVGILPPLLYVAAVQTSVPAFRLKLRPILLLAVGLTLFTTVAVGLVLHAVIPALPLAATFALGAIVAPPDAVSASAVAARVGLPRRLVTVLEGESLVNDATALVTLRVAVGAVTGTAASMVGWGGAGRIAWSAILAAGGGLVIGLAVAVVVAFIHRRVTDPLLDNALSLLTPFLAFFPAEAIHASGVVAVVIAGLYLGHRWPLLMSAASRLQMEAFWRMVRFLLEGAVFLLVGLQLRMIVRQLHQPFPVVAAATAAVIGTVIACRFVYVFPALWLPRWLVPGIRRREPMKPGWRYPTVVSWAGMRGVVTLAAAFSLPRLAHGLPFPGRDLFQWLAFAVIIVTLVVQGLTLPAVVRRVRIAGDDPRQDALVEAAVQNRATQAALDRLTELSTDLDPPEYVTDRLRRLAQSRTNQAWERLGDPERAPSLLYRRLRQGMIEAEREVFLDARNAGRIPAEVADRAQRDMDLEESLISREE